MTTFNEYLKKALLNPEFKAEYDALEAEFTLQQALIDARRHCDMTQAELALASGVNQAAISRIENGTANPSLQTLKKLAKGLNSRLKISFA